jgi:hypothetical protein
MNKLDRYKILIRHAKERGYITSQKDLAYKIGYKDEVSFSQIINGKTKEPKDFIQRICSIIPGLNENWLLFGEGEMLKGQGEGVSISNINGDNIGCGHDNTINNNDLTIHALLDQMKVKDIQITKSQEQITKSQEQISKSQEQIDRLISLLEKK